MVCLPLFLIFLVNHQTSGSNEPDPDQELKANVSCHHPAEKGSCLNYFERWYFDERMKRCLKFAHSGCGGNGNRFDRQYECEKICNPTRCIDIFCSNWVGEYTKCSIPENRDIINLELKKQIGKIDCERPKRKYAIHQNNIWVWKGCKGIFHYCFTPKLEILYDNVECSSQVLEETKCEIPSLRKLVQVSLSAQYSDISCTEPYRKFKLTNDNHLVVMKGCHGAFSYGYILEGGKCGKMKQITDTTDSENGSDLFHPQCKANSLYREDQCDPKKGECWCVDSESGFMLEGTKRNITAGALNCELQINLKDTTWDWFEDGDTKTGQIKFIEQQRIIWNDNGIIQGVWTLEYDILRLAFNGMDYNFKLNIFTGEAYSFSEKEESSAIKMIQRVQKTCHDLVSDMLRKVTNDIFVPECNADGNYVRRQCHAFRRECWCVDRINGVMIPNTKKSDDDEEQVDCDNWILTAESVCFGAKNDEFGSFRMKKAGTYDAFKLVYKSGYVSCIDDDDDTGKSNWGCGGKELYVVIGNNKAGILFPRLVNSKGFYSLKGYTSHSESIVLENVLNQMIVEKDAWMRIWYGEDIKKYMEHDNHGRVCADVYARLTTQEQPYIHKGCFSMGVLDLETICETKSVIRSCYLRARSFRHKYFGINNNYNCFTFRETKYFRESSGCNYGRGNTYGIDLYEIKDDEVTAIKDSDENGFRSAVRTPFYSAIADQQQNNTRSILYSSDDITISGEITLTSSPLLSIAPRHSCVMIQLKDITKRPPVFQTPFVYNISGGKIRESIAYQIQTDKPINVKEKRVVTLLAGLTIGHCNEKRKFEDGFLRPGDYLSTDYDLVLDGRKSSYIQNIVLDVYAKRLYKDGKRRVTAYWGQDRAGQHSLQTEQSLKDVCSNFHYDVISILFVHNFFSRRDKDNLPMTSLSHHCNHVFSEHYELNNCTNVGKEIRGCQQKGKFITLSLGYRSNKNSFKNADEAISFAVTIWNLFLGGKSNFRPFGDDVILNGIDLNIDSENYHFYRDFVRAIRELMNGDKKREYSIAASLRCSFDKSLIGDFIQDLDHLYIRGWTPKGSGECHLDKLIGNWFDLVAVITKSHFGFGPDIHFVLSADRRQRQGSDSFIKIFEIRRLIMKLSLDQAFGGVVIDDASYDSNNVIKGKYYSTHISRIINTRHLYGTWQDVDDNNNSDILDVKDIIIIVISVVGFFVSLKIIYWRYKNAVASDHDDTQPQPFALNSLCVPKAYSSKCYLRSSNRNQSSSA